MLLPLEPERLRSCLSQTSRLQRDEMQLLVTGSQVVKPAVRVTCILPQNSLIQIRQGIFFFSKPGLKQGSALLKVYGLLPLFVHILVSVLFPLLLSFWNSNLQTQLQFSIVNKFKLE
ncbi:hypothetical protein AV530_010778 [Patagioenas fasciata monilis]|uniref:Uncharacterized protein n=1 Tax=Patagioenas fasciata monilis TaxID=372326 RepID=A0A1V4K7P3_PATFA|nr:hypothetical protein AV530_010778 [Patagioenas fasciata monilis]